MISRTLAVASLLGILSACSLGTNEGVEENAAPIVGGKLEGGHPAVGHLTFTAVSAEGVKGPDGDWTCTATLVTPNVLLTAAHCIVPSTPGARYVDHKVTFHVFGALQKHTANAIKAIAHPKYDGNISVADYDIGVIELDQDIPIQPVKVARTLGDIVGKDVTLVGYGAGYANGRFADGRLDRRGLGVKRSITLPVTRQSPDEIVAGNGKGGACGGDSGSPALLHAPGGEPIVVAVLSRIDDSDYCSRNSYSGRSDRYVNFLAPYMSSAFVDVSDEVELPTPGGGGVFNASCCIGDECYACKGKSAHDRCVGFDLDACFSECGMNASCLIGCTERFPVGRRGPMPQDPSACEKLPSSKAPQGGSKEPQSKVGPLQSGQCNTSSQCVNGRCYCTNEKAGAPCREKTGRPNSCSVVCRVCK